MEIASKQDFDRLELKLDQLTQIMDKIRQDVKDPEDIKLNASQIMDQLDIRSRATFDKRIKRLEKFGMFRDGRPWFMMQSKLNDYKKHVGYN
ncbi:MAG: hypothetical protein KAT68_17860 [Bacteroidales bacterium]|nr:hypothetical protein [Bacteroidales bacterium]